MFCERKPSMCSFLPGTAPQGLSPYEQYRLARITNYSGCYDPYRIYRGLVPAGQPAVFTFYYGQNQSMLGAQGYCDSTCSYPVKSASYYGAQFGHRSCPGATCV